MHAPARTWRPNRVGSIYVLGVAAVSTLGFSSGSTSMILIAALFALPSSVVALPAYYGVYGLLALLPGANPSSSTGSGACAPDGDCQMSTTGDAAAWFTFATDAVGIIALTVAALLNAVILHKLIAARRT